MENNKINALDIINLCFKNSGDCNIDNMAMDIMNVFLQCMKNSDIVESSYVQELLEMNRRKELLKKHQYTIWQGKDGRWRTYLPAEDHPYGRRLIKRMNRESVEEAIIEYYGSLKENQPKTFNDVYWMWRKVQDELVESPNTPVRYDSDYKRYFRDSEFTYKLIEDIREDDVKLFLHRQIKDLSLCKKSAKTLFGYINRVFRCAKMNELIFKSPVEYLRAKDFYKYCTPSKRSQTKQVFSNMDMSRLNKIILQDFDKHPLYIPTYAVALATFTGMRVGELAALRWEDISEETIIIRCSEKYNRKTKEYYIDSTKNDKIRTFPITLEIKNILDRVKKSEMQCGYFCEWVFANEKGRIHAPMISSCLKNKCRQAGISEKGIHAIRKTVNSKMRCHGVSATIAASLLGHTEEVNEQYYTFDVSDLREKKEIVEVINREVLSCV